MIDIEDFIKQKIKAEEKRKYHKEYMKDYNRLKKNENRYTKVILVEYQRTPEVDEQRLDIIPVNCSTFGCPRTLTMNEKLFGNKCSEHSAHGKIIGKFQITLPTTSRVP